MAAVRRWRFDEEASPSASISLLLLLVLDDAAAASVGAFLLALRLFVDSPSWRVQHEGMSQLGAASS